MIRPIYTHSREIFVEIMKSRIKYHIPTYGDGEVLKVLSLQKNHGGFILELERQPMEMKIPKAEPIKEKMHITDFR